ncbi:MAG TPA: ABC transporter permease subunit [Steroidobacteraceae bacterium]|nr:ABC transporter permease subunit [Steroidobacteraceae bacterium]
MIEAVLLRRSLWSAALGRLRASRAAACASGLLLTLLLLAVLAPALSPYRYDQLDWQHLAAPPWSAGHWLGTDRLGRDLLVRVAYGTRLSLLLGLTASAISVLIGIAWGAMAGYVGGRTDAVLMRTVDVLNSLPTLFLVIALTSVIGRGSPGVLLLAVGAVGWLTLARIVRGQTLALRRRDFMLAALVSGARTPHILARHVVPNVLGAVIAYAALTIPQIMLFESFLSFLGLGVQEPLASLGSLVRAGANEMESAPWMLLVPAAVLLTMLASLSVLGDALRDALDPRAE